MVFFNTLGGGGGFIQNEGKWFIYKALESYIWDPMLSKRTVLEIMYAKIRHSIDFEKHLHFGPQEFISTTENHTNIGFYADEDVSMDTNDAGIADDVHDSKLKEHHIKKILDRGDDFNWYYGYHNVYDIYITKYSIGLYRYTEA